MAWILVAGVFSHAYATEMWNPKAAAAYLDRRMDWWMTWRGAARDHDTFCISCHTAVPYALSRATLHAALRETTSSPAERELLGNVTKRVRLWRDVGPFYHDNAAKDAQSRGTEAVLNALILSDYDSRSGRLSDDTRASFANMWSLQLTTGDARGAWSWLQFNNEPWEARGSTYYGAVLAATAVAAAPEQYRSAAEIQSGISRLREYLNRDYVNQSPMNRVLLLAVSVKWPRLLTAEQQRSIIYDIVGMQRADGGWSLGTLAWTWRNWNLSSLVKMWIRSDGTPLEGKSDGYATGVITIALRQAGFSRRDVQISRGLKWLVRNQNKTEGGWPGYSLNSRRNPSSDIGHFMSDAATAYAVLALTSSN